MNLSKFNLFFAFVALFLCATCGDLSINRGDATPGVRTITAINGTIADEDTLVVSGDYLVSKATGTADVLGCTKSTSDGASTAGTFASLSDYLDETDEMLGQNFSTTSLGWMEVTAIKFHLAKSGGPSGNLTGEIRAASGSVPSGTAASSSTDSVSQSTPTTGSGALVTFSYATPLELAGGNYAVVLMPDAAQGLGDDIRWMASNNSTTACSDASLAFAEAASSSDTGATFSSIASRKALFAITATTHALSGSASWIVSAYANAVWDLSTFTPTENPESTGGSITYDLGAGDDFNSPSYSLTGLTAAQVQAQTDLVGTYLFLKATLTVDSPGNNRANLSDMTIEAK